MHVNSVLKIFLVALSVTGAVASPDLFAKPVSLLCKGEVQYAGEGPTSRTYEVEFDDQKNDLLSMTKELSMGCTLDVNDEHSKALSCNCKVTKEEISCRSVVLGKKFVSHRHEDNFTISRKTGRLTTSYSFIGKDVNGANFSFFRSGELTCEKFTSKKF